MNHWIKEQKKGEQERQKDQENQERQKNLEKQQDQKDQKMQDLSWEEEAHRSQGATKPSNQSLADTEDEGKGKPGKESGREDSGEPETEEEVF